MRPVPRSRHLAAIMIFAAVSVATGATALLDPHLTESQYNTAAAALKRHQPELFPHDAVFGPSGLWRFQTPAVQAVLELLLVPTGYQDLTLPFRILAPIALMVYLCAMYALLYRQCGIWSVAAFVAVLSMKITWTLGWSHWGVGAVSSIEPQTLAQVAVPVIVLAFLRYASSWRIVLVFLGIGLLGNLHLITAVNLAIVLGVVYLARRRFALSAWPAVAGLALCVAAGAGLYVAYYLGLRLRTDAIGGDPATPEMIHAALKASGLDVLYPELLGDLLNWLLWAALLIVPATAVLLRIERFPVRDWDVWVWFLLAGLVVALGFQAISQAVAAAVGRFPLFIDFHQAASLVMLPLYVLFAQALTGLFRLVGTHRGLLRLGCAILLAGWLIPSDNLRYVRHRGYELSAWLMGAEHRSQRVERVRRRALEQAELARIAAWARDETNTPPGAVLVTDEPSLRPLARRSLLVSGADVKYVFYLAPTRLGAWARLVQRQARALSPGESAAADPKQIRALIADASERPPRRDAPAWYIVLDADAAPPRPGGLELIENPGWGSAYHLYRAE